MAKREPVLKWRKVKDEWRAGPFRIEEHIDCADAFYAAYIGSYWMDDFSLHECDDAKAACERLARKIIAATKKGRKHGK